MTFTVEMEGVEAWETGQILPPGTHRVEVVDAKEGTSTKGHPQLEVELRAFEGEFDGGTIRDWITVIPSTAGKVKQILAALGRDDLDQTISFEASDLVGKRAQIMVRNEPYEGKDRSRVKAYEPVSGESSPSKSDTDDLPF